MRRRIVVYQIASIKLRHRVRTRHVMIAEITIRQMEKTTPMHVARFASTRCAVSWTIFAANAFPSRRPSFTGIKRC